MRERDYFSARITPTDSTCIWNLPGFLSLGMKSSPLIWPGSTGPRTMRGIRPETLDDLGLRAAVEEYAASLAGPSLDVAAAVAAEVDGVAPLVQTAAFRIVQEACANARRHSGTTRIRITLRMDGDVLEIRIEDSAVASTPPPRRTRASGSWAWRSGRVCAEAGAASRACQPRARW
jgi:glucose-6-phosphate-specific signal transduction histidine kinase